MKIFKQLKQRFDLLQWKKSLKKIKWKPLWGLVADMTIKKMNKKIVVLLVIGWLFFFDGTVWGASETGAPVLLPVKGTVTMIDLGATACIPCKMMAPILKKLEKEYGGKAAIVFIDVWKDRSQARRFKIRAIPTQIFFNKEGKEVFRHVGFMSEKAIIKQLKKMGVD